MKMKSIFIALASAALLASCGGAKWQSYSWKRVLSGAEKNALLFKVQEATLAKLSRLESKTTSMRNTKLQEQKIEVSEFVEFYLKGEAYGEQTQKTTNKVNGIIEKSERTAKTSFVQFDEENHKFARSSEDSLDGTFDYSQMVADEGYALDYSVQNIFGTLSSGGISAYENNKGEQFFLSSSEAESNNQVEIEHGFKVDHTRTRTQIAALLNKDLSLKSFTRYSSQERNRDPDTAEFYKKDKLISEATQEYKFIYKDKADGSSKLASFRQLAKEGYRTNGVPTLKFTSYKADNSPIYEEFVDFVEAKRVAFNKTHYIFNCDALDPSYLDVDHIKFKLYTSSISNAKDDPVVSELDVSFNEYLAGNSGTSYADGAIKMGKGEFTFTIELDLEAGAEGAVLSNVNANAALYYAY